MGAGGSFLIGDFMAVGIGHIHLHYRIYDNRARLGCRHRKIGRLYGCRVPQNRKTPIKVNKGNDFFIPMFFPKACPIRLPAGDRLKPELKVKVRVDGKCLGEGWGIPRQIRQIVRRLRIEGRIGNDQRVDVMDGEPGPKIR